MDDRIDYVLVRHDMLPDCKLSQVLFDLDLGNQDQSR